MKVTLDAKAIESLYRVHGHSVLRRARRILGDDEEAREVLQEVFAALLHKPTQLRGESSMTTWLYASTTHDCLNRLRNKRTRARLLATQLAPGQEGAPPRAESMAIVRELLARIPAELAQAAVYYYADEMTHDEIATVLGCSRRHVGDLIASLHAHAKEEQRLP